MTEWPTGTDDEQQAVERLLRAASPRVEPPADVERELREELRAEWRGIVSEARVRRRRMTLSLAAGVALVAVGAVLATSLLREPAPVIATVAVAHGELRVADGWIGRWRPLADGAALRTGQRLATGPQARGALQLTNGLSLRLDHATRVAMGEVGHVGIEQGALYVDTGAAGSPAADLRVATPAGDVRHVGTQYEVRLAGRDVTVRVREGSVELLRQDEVLAEGRAGEQLAIGPAGRLTRSETAIHGASWDWAAATAPSFDIDGRTLLRFPCVGRSRTRAAHRLRDARGRGRGGARAAQRLGRRTDAGPGAAGRHGHDPAARATRRRSRRHPAGRRHGLSGDVGAAAHPARAQGLPRQAAGGTLALSLNRLPGSYFFFSVRNRAKLPW